MILILSIAFDQNTTNVINWLIDKNEKFIRVNENDYIEDLEFIDLDFHITIKKQKFKLSEITAFWYRRGYFSFDNNKFLLTHELYNSDFTKKINTFKKREIHKCVEYIYQTLAEKKASLGNFYNTDINKLLALKYASECELNIPRTAILNNQHRFEEYFSEHDTITKPIGEVENFSTDTSEYRLYTEKVPKKEPNIDEYFYSLFQTEIKKNIEIRVFYLDNRFYSMAIFSQNDDKTQVDFRKYNRTKPNRTVPFNLPVDIEEKLKRLLKKMNFNCASIDLILSSSQEYYFLEINPIGQFGMVSYPCNYYLERLVAGHLSTK